MTRACSVSLDANGNVITKNDGFSWALTYDYDNRLTKVVRAGSTVLQNVYDGDGKRVKKTESNPIVFTYQGLNALYEKDLTAGVVTKRFYANGLQVAKMVGSTTTYLHEDHIGSIRFISSSTGSQVFSSNYVPYGPQFGASGTPDEFLYAGKIYDGSTGFYYFGARYYDPTIGRFVTQDSFPGVNNDPQSFNRYAYARDNPLKVIDQNGHDWNSFGALTSAFSAASPAAAIVVPSFASPLTNWWNSLSPQTQVQIITVAVVAAAVTATVLTGGIAALVIAPALAPSLGATAAALTAGALTTGVLVPSLSTIITTSSYSATAGNKATPAGILNAASKGLEVGAQIDVAALGIGGSIYGAYRDSRQRSPYPSPSSISPQQSVYDASSQDLTHNLSSSISYGAPTYTTVLTTQIGSTISAYSVGLAGRYVY